MPHPTLEKPLQAPTRIVPNSDNPFDLAVAYPI